jgi:hypothetical protein
LTLHLNEEIRASVCLNQTPFSVDTVDKLTVGPHLACRMERRRVNLFRMTRVFLALYLLLSCLSGWRDLLRFFGAILKNAEIQVDHHDA